MTSWFKLLSTTTHSSASRNILMLLNVVIIPKHIHEANINVHNFFPPNPTLKRKRLFFFLFKRTLWMALFSHSCTLLPPSGHKWLARHNIASRYCIDFAWTSEFDFIATGAKSITSMNTVAIVAIQSHCRKARQLYLYFSTAGQPTVLDGDSEIKTKKKKKGLNYKS